MLGGKNKSSACFDTFPAHLTEQVREQLARIGNKLLVIPGGCTSVFRHQPHC